MRKSHEGNAMQKNDIAMGIARKLGLSQTEAKLAVQLTFMGMIEALASEGRLELRNFGVFTVRERRARKARNPRTGEPAMVRAHKAVRFKPGKIMLNQVRSKAEPNKKRDKE
jgi:nucleoid DNA-binding protein